MNDFTLRNRITHALLEHDAMIASCPVSNPKHGVVFGPSDACPVCKAKASDTCGRSVSAGYQLAKAVASAVSL